jgi:hypothetical protein
MRHVCVCAKLECLIDIQMLEAEGSAAHIAFVKYDFRVSPINLKFECASSTIIHQTLFQTQI